MLSVDENPDWSKVIIIKKSEGILNFNFFCLFFSQVGAEFNFQITVIAVTVRISTNISKQYYIPSSLEVLFKR